jgi:flagellar motor switch protein FliM
MEPILKKMNSQDYLTLLKKEPTEDDQRSLLRTVENTDIIFTVDLGRINLSVDDFMNLQENEFLLLDTKIVETLIARIQKHKKFMVSPGRKGKQRVVRIDNIIDEEGDVV